MQKKELQKSLQERGYMARSEELQAVHAACSGVGSALLLEGPPGCGKSFLAEATASVLGAFFIPQQFHAWTDSDELFCGVDVVSAVAGEAATVRQHGTLAIAAQKSQEGRVVLLLDEIDKSPERAEFLLLDFLQTGRVPIKPGLHVRANLASLVVFITTNGERELSDALLRRVRRVRMAPLGVEVCEEILARTTEFPRSVVRIAWKIAREIAEYEGNNALSVQEGKHLLAEIIFAESVEDVRRSLAGWAARTQKGAEYARRCQGASAVWGEISATRRGGGR